MARADFLGTEFGPDRLEAGVTTMRRCVSMLLARNGFTHEKFVEFSKWCNPWGQGWLSTSQVSYLRTGKLDKAGPKTLDALGQINLRLAEAAGDKSPIVQELPDFSDTRIPVKLPEQPFFLRHPISFEPLDTGGLYLIWIGRLRPEGLDQDHISDMEARKLSTHISQIVQAWARDHQLMLSEAIDVAINFYSVTDKKRQQKPKEVIFGFSSYTGEELVEELMNLGQMLGALDGDGPIKPEDVRDRLYDLPRMA